MLRPRLDENTMRRFHQQLAKSEALGKTARSDEDLRVRDYANDATQNLARDAVARMSVNNAVQPAAA